MEASPKEENSMSVLMDKLTESIIIDKDLNNFKQLIRNSSREWCRMTNTGGYTLLQEAIKRNSKEMFDYILRFHDMVDLEAVNFSGQTALMIVMNWEWNKWKECSEYYACELINKGAFVHTICENAQCDTFLHRAIAKSSMKVTKLLLEKGIDVNVQDKDGRTALHNVLLKGPHSDDYEFVAALLCYGADPFIECLQGYNAFELSVLHNNIVPIQEILFYYTFDKSECSEIQSNVLLQLAKAKSPFLYQILEFDLEFKFVCFKDRVLFFCYLLLMEVDCLRVLLRKHNFAIGEMIESIVNDSQWTQHIICDGNVTEVWSKSLNSEHPLTNLSFLVEHDTTLNHHIVNFIRELDSYPLCSYIICEMDQAHATEILIYMFLYGLKCNSVICDLVYRNYGYSDLFKFLLHLDFENDDRIEMLPYPENIIINFDRMFPVSKNVMPNFICDINLDLSKFVERLNNYFWINDVELLDYFAHPNLSNSLLNQWCNFSSENLRKIKNHPRLPCLVELSRNAFRKYFVDRLNIKTTKQFYCLLNGLPISPVHKRIITLETKLY